MENQIQSVDLQEVLNTYTRANLDAQMILTLCAGVKQLTAENENLKKQLEALAPKENKETKKGG